MRGADNFKKKLQGQLAGADAIDLIAKKTAQEKEFRAWALDAGRKARMEPVIAALDATIDEANAARLAALRYGTCSTADNC